MIENYFKQIEKKFNSLEQKERVKSFLNYGSKIILVFSILLFFILILEAVFQFDSLVRTILFFTFLTALIFSIAANFIFPYFIKTKFQQKHYRAAKRVGAFYPGIKDDLLNAIQLIDDESVNGSEELKNAAFKTIYERVKDFDFNESVSFQSLRKFFYASGIVFALLIAAIFSSSAIKNSTYRFINYNQDFTPKAKFIFNISPGNIKITKGGNVNLKIKTLGSLPQFAEIFIKKEEDAEFSSKKLSADSLGIFNLNINNIRSSTKYYAQAENIKSDVFNIEVIDRPLISEFEIEISPPVYTGLPAVIQKDNGSFSALPGSRVEIKGSSSKELSSAEINFSDSTKKSFEITGKDFSGTVNISKEFSYSINIIDSENISNENPIVYEVKLLKDEFPGIEMLSPNKDIKIKEGSVIPLSASISDDYGFSKLLFHYRLSSSLFDQPWENFKTINIQFSRKKLEQEVYYSWDIAPLYLGADDVVSYYLEVFDNDNISGPKSAKTKIFTIRIPSLNELFNQAETAQNDVVKDMKEVMDEAEKLRKEIQEINNELKSDRKEVTWEEKQKIEKSMEKFEELQNKVQDMQQKMNEMQKEMSENNLLSEETLQKYMELQKMMDEMTSDELKNAFERMQKSLEQLMKQNVQQEMQNMQVNEEAFKKSIERTLNLLKRIQIEQKIDELVKRSENIKEQQEELAKNDDSNNENSEQNSDTDQNQKSKENAAKQEQISKDLQNFEQQMEKLQEMMESMSDMPKEDLEKLMEEFKKQQNKELSDQAKQNLMQNQMQSAQQQQMQISQNMQQMMESMMNMQSQMAQQNQMKVMADMMKMINNLLNISEDQEQLKNETQQLSQTSPQLNEKAQEQNNMQRNLNNVLQQASELSQKTFAITPEMGKALGQAMRNMNQALSAMQNRNNTLAAHEQNSAMAAINEAASLMQSSMSQMMQGQGQGMMPMMQQLQQLSQQQQMLNQLTQSMNQGQLSQQQMAQLQKLGQQQDMIRKSLSELNKEAKESGQSKKLTSNLEQILDEMNEVVSNLKSEDLNDDLIQRQERILSKMLDAQRSINERDFEKRRESNEGNLFARETPPELLLKTKEGREKLKDELMKAVKEGYSKDYEELIRKYFEALDKAEKKN